MDHISAHFHIVVQKDRGGTLLAPIFGSGCIAPVIFESAGGMALMKQMGDRERAMIEDRACALHRIGLDTTPV